MLIQTSNLGYKDCDELKTAFKWDSVEHEDAQQYYSCILQKIYSILEDCQLTNFIRDLFEGMLNFVNHIHAIID